MDALPDLLRAALAEMTRGRYAEAVALLEPHAHQPSNELQRYLGESLRRVGRAQDAIAPLMQALALKFDDVDAYLQLAFALQSLQLKAEAAECFRTVAALQPDSVMAQAYQAHGDQQCARWSDFEPNLQALHAALRAKPDDAADEFGVPFALAALPHAGADLLKIGRLSARFLSRGLRPLPAVRAVAKPRLRVGYLSSDFHAHATAALMVEVLEAHDRARFEVLLFSHGPDDGSALQRRVRAACERVIDVGDLDPAALAARMRAEGVDIAVDLKGHTAGSRFAALAARPAPVQVAWLGFPGTCGADFIDYVIGDPVVTPLADAPVYSERIAQLPRCYQPGDAQRRIVPTPRATLGLPEDALVLLSANAVYKITPPLFDAWMAILHRLPRALLWQLSGGEQADAQLLLEAQARGIAPERLVFMPPTDMASHWNRLAAADLALDTWPCNGHTTTSDALAAGVPVVTLRGDGFASRVAESLLTAAGLPELVRDTLDDYVETACALAAGPKPAIQPWIDSRAFARDLEALYERMWARAVAGLPPEALPAMPGA
ncbi:UDP-N-acetylglucosamine-peptide N-acetylglucosaminyltransferase [Mitsuaria sp. GD03876]|uniref:O-linked N-acetylglucosamine transferase, SPINDLY family protein n=1 Tax=Mitsuaria sp. GD03876 TaxID=2975399 RepID=UPI0024494BCF|nr:UDP-N-acetylglucosamine-peptide N-acetylglucosaminyltransferase [Mitsuaria sp. GD03876]MDH0864619.1 UDP-N-acetylglucosamine-peptide N-acetylglucosaminyltransferase [Mitsuaria sp. GD03876]